MKSSRKRSEEAITEDGASVRLKAKRPKSSLCDITDTVKTIPEVQSNVINKAKRRPWRNKIRKQAAKKAAKLQRQNAVSENAALKEVQGAVLKEKSKKKKKKKKSKKKTEANPSVDATSTVNENDTACSSSLSDAQKRLECARFRFINQQLYSCNGEEALQMFQHDPQAFQIYHHGYRSQMKKWPFNPLNGIIQWLRTMISKSEQRLVIADLGCGEARIAELLSDISTVHSFDLVAVNDRVTTCNMAKLPLQKESVDVAVFCLSLMGTNLSDYLREANRILKRGGIMKIAEVGSRFVSLKQFIHGVGKMGFELMEKKATKDSYFVILEFNKIGKVTQKRPIGLKLQACMYKKR